MSVPMIARAQGINAHLPSDVRVLACQRVNNGFNARDRCADRTYQYYLPSSAIGISAAGAPSAFLATLRPWGQRH